MMRSLLLLRMALALALTASATPAAPSVPPARRTPAGVRPDAARQRRSEVLPGRPPRRRRRPTVSRSSAPSLDGKAYLRAARQERGRVSRPSRRSPANSRRSIPSSSRRASGRGSTTSRPSPTTARRRNSAWSARSNGRIDHVDVTADDRTATVTVDDLHLQGWRSISFQQTYDLIDGNYVVRAQTGKVDLPLYNADVASTFSNYKLNVKIDQQVFATD